MAVARMGTCAPTLPAAAPQGRGCIPQEGACRHTPAVRAQVAAPATALAPLPLLVSIRTTQQLPTAAPTADCEHHSSTRSAPPGSQAHSPAPECTPTERLHPRLAIVPVSPQALALAEELPRAPQLFHNVAATADDDGAAIAPTAVASPFGIGHVSGVTGTDPEETSERPEDRRSWLQLRFAELLANAPLLFALGLLPLLVAAGVWIAAQLG